MGIVNSKFIYSTTGTAALAAAFLYYYFIRPITARRANSNYALVLGLKNFGYTCYLNSILQALASCDQFTEWIRITNDSRLSTVVDYDAPKINNSDFTSIKSGTKKLTLNRAAFPIVQALHRSFILINRVIRGDDDINSSEVPGELMKVFNQVLDDKYKSESRISVNIFRLIDTEEQDTHEVFNHLMSNLSDEFGSEMTREYNKSVRTLITHQRNESVEIATEMDNGLTGGCSLTVEMETDGGGAGNMGIRSSNTFKRTSFTLKDSNRNLLKSKVDPEEQSHPTLDLTLSNSFQGTSGSQLQCNSCLAKRSIHIESFSSVSLNLPPLRSICGTVSIYELLETFTKSTIVHSVDCDSCSKIAGVKTQSSFRKKSAFAKLPANLCIHILRTEWNRDGLSYKRKDHVSFPIRLNLIDVSRVNDIMSSENKKARSERKHQIRNDESGDFSESSSRHRNSQYTLRAIVSHRGDVDSGHFITYRRSPKNENGEEVWLLVSDMVVVPVKLAEVLMAKAYMLFYEKIGVNKSDGKEFPLVSAD